MEEFPKIIYQTDKTFKEGIEAQWKEKNPEKVLVYQDKSLAKKRNSKEAQERPEKHQPSSL